MLKNFYNIVPKPLLDNSKFKGFIDKAKEYYDSLRNQILLIKSYRNPSLTRFPKELAIHENAFFIDSDTIQNIRKAIEDSRIARRKPTSFETWKPVIDRITNSNSQIWKGNIQVRVFQFARSIFGQDILGSTNVIQVGNFKFGQSQFGVNKLGFRYEPNPLNPDTISPIYGNVYIDLGKQASESELDEIVKRLNHLKYSFYSIWLGYLNSYNLGNFRFGQSQFGVDRIGGNQYFIKQRRI